MSGLMFPKPTRRDRPKRRIRRRATIAAVRAELKAQGPGVSEEQWAAILIAQGGRCAYCGHPPASGVLTQDHVEPLARGGRHDVSNLVAACLACNVRKGTARWTPILMHPGFGATGPEAA